MACLPMRAAALSALVLTSAAAQVYASHIDDRQRDERTHVKTGMSHDRSHTMMITEQVVEWELLRSLGVSGTRMGASGRVASGDFDTPIETRVFELSARVGYAAAPYWVSASLPFYYVDTDNGSSDSDTGIGDLWLSLGRDLLASPAGGTFLSGLVSLKLPTADEDKALGTGEADYGASVTAGRRFTRHTLSATAGYIVVGDPLGVDYQNRYLFSAGLTRRLTERAGAYASVDAMGASQEGFDDPRWLSLGLFRRTPADYTFSFDARLGLNEAAGDLDLGVGISKWF